MRCTLNKLGSELLDRLDDGADILAIAQWAHSLYLNPDTDTSDGEVLEEIMRLIAMEEGPEFEYSRVELREMANALMHRGGASKR